MKPALLVIVGVLAQTLPLRAQDLDNAKVRKVKAAYLYNFAKFVEWPDNTFKKDKTPFVIGVLGDDLFSLVLDDTVRSRTIAGRSVKIRRFRWTDEEDRAEIIGCQILYIGTSEQDRLHEILDTLRQRHVLLVSDIPEFARDGGMIGYVLDQGRIVFEVNRESLKKGELKASSKLLQLARIVESRGRRNR